MQESSKFQVTERHEYGDRDNIPVEFNFQGWKEVVDLLIESNSLRHQDGDHKHRIVEFLFAPELGASNVHVDAVQDVNIGRGKVRLDGGKVKIYPNTRVTWDQVKGDIQGASELVRKILSSRE